MIAWCLRTPLSNLEIFCEKSVLQPVSVGSVGAFVAPLLRLNDSSGPHGQNCRCSSTAKTLLRELELFESCFLPCTCSVITQEGNSLLMIATRMGWTDVVSLLINAGAALDLQNKVRLSDTVCKWSEPTYIVAWIAQFLHAVGTVHTLMILTTVLAFVGVFVLVTMLCSL